MTYFEFSDKYNAISDEMMMKKIVKFKHYVSFLVHLYFKFQVLINLSLSQVDYRSTLFFKE